MSALIASIASLAKIFPRRLARILKMPAGRRFSDFPQHVQDRAIERAREKRLARKRRNLFLVVFRGGFHNVQGGGAWPVRSGGRKAAA